MVWAQSGKQNHREFYSAGISLNFPGEGLGREGPKKAVLRKPEGRSPALSRQKYRWGLWRNLEVRQVGLLEWEAGAMQTLTEV